VVLQQMSVDTWTRFEVYCDYGTQKWGLRVNGTNVAENLSFYSAGTQVESWLIANESPASAYVDGLAVADNNDASLPFTETFEVDNSVVAGSLQGQNGWVVKSGSATVQSGVIYSGSQSLALQSSKVSRGLTSNSKDVWHQLNVFLADANTAAPISVDDNAPFAFSVGSDLNLVVFSNKVPITLSKRIDTNVWTRFDVYCDYDHQRWSLSVNGTNVVAGLPFYSAAQSVSALTIDGTGYIDQIRVLGVENPSVNGNIDFDNDGIPDWWEQKYFGGITNALASGVASNGFTYLQAYIAGLLPNDAGDQLFITKDGGRKLGWIRKLGRIYDVYWTPDLKTPFQAIVTDIQADVFEDADASRLVRPAGFYQIRVRK
ncbi:MAG: hypothetical protein IT583_00005, partial [Verrucomicrobia bacterium]|nr:hypothetical protein [Verrucomicrobiota bacterium]